MMGAPLRAAVLAAALAVVPATAQAGTITATLDPPYEEGVTGANGWYRVPVTATYTCTPGPLETVVECPPTETFGDGTGTDAEGRTLRTVRTARFATLPPADDTARVTLVSAPRVPLRVDMTPPPPPVITAPAVGAVIRPGAVLAADFTCSFAGDRSGPSPAGACTGTVAAGVPVPSGTADPATWGPRLFTVTARDAAGNIAAATAAYRIEPEPAPPPPPPPASPVTTAPPPLVAPAAPTAPAVRRAVTPKVRNARVLRPRPGAALKRRGVLRWRRAGAATVYNVQVFRIAGTRYRKVLTAFPRGTTLRMPPRRLVPGQRYVWRVWPYVGKRARYSRAPMGISWFRAVR